MRQERRVLYGYQPHSDFVEEAPKAWYPKGTDVIHLALSILKSLITFLEDERLISSFQHAHRACHSSAL